ncbi:unnamed protein product [Acanthoscelides obtectus]|uniref:Uncharacterized protein n=1 Tax=Acanthoscelides obtectus TaxID=200917 RepID=A0A9P0P5D2_ACAOB|nr:unnamed protein product [Acanthoscelides obtectus]CAK1632299.1 hypothetical protein AOBTE_LOCUS7470 [Acanthoscelides obtectus]
MFHISQHRRANMAGFTLQLLVFFGLVCLSYQQKNYARYGLQESNDYVSEDGLKMLAKDDETGSPIAKLLGSYLEGSQLVLNVTDQLGEGIIGLIKVLINNTNDLPKTLGKIFHIEVLVKKVFNPQLQDLTKKVLQQFKDLPILVQIFDRLNKILGRQSKDKVDKHSA